MSATGVRSRTPTRPSGPAEGPDEDTRRLRNAIVLTALTGAGLAVGLATALLDGPAWLRLGGYALAYGAAGVPLAVEVGRSLLDREITIDLLMLLAGLAAAAVGEPRDGAILLFLFTLAETLEDYAMGRTKRAVTGLMQLRPDAAPRTRSESPGGAGLESTRS